MFPLIRFTSVLFVSAATLLAQEDIFDNTGAASSERRSSRDVRREIVSVGKDAIVATGEVVRSAVVVGGNLIVDGEVGEAVVVGGDLTVNGRVDRDSVVVMGNATYSSNAIVGGEVVVVGGTLEAAPGAQLDRDRREFAFEKFFPKIKWISQWFRYGLLWARPLPHQFAWAWILALISIAVCALAAMISPGGVNRCAKALERRPVGSVVVGFFVLLLFLPVVGLLIASVIGLIAAPFLVCAFVAAAVLGTAGVCRIMGQRILGRTDEHSGPALLVALGALVLLISYFIPILGFLVWGMVATVAIGSATIAAFPDRRAKAPPQPAPVAQSPTALPPSVAAAPTSPTGEEVNVSASKTAPAPQMSHYAGGERVGFWLRLAATALDAVLFAGVAAVLPSVLVPLLWLAYHVGLWAWKGTTIGGIILGLQIVRVDGRPMDWATASIRALGAFFSGAVFFLGFFWVAWDPNRQSWHDKIAGTVVVKAARGVALV